MREVERTSGVFPSTRRHAPRRLVVASARASSPLSGPDAWQRLGAGFAGMTAFMAAGVLRLCSGVPALLYLAVACLSLATLVAALVLPDGCWRAKVKTPAAT